MNIVKFEGKCENCNTQNDLFILLIGKKPIIICRDCICKLNEIANPIYLKLI